MVSWRLDQGTQQLAVGGLDTGPSGEDGAGLPHALSELVAHALEGAEVKHAGHRRRRGDPIGDVEAAEAVEGQMRQLELEATDLAAQLGAGEALVAGIRAPLGVPSPEQIAG
jgi:hypothetical protein